MLAPLLRVFDLITAGYYPPHHYAFIAYLTIPFLLWFGFRRSTHWLKRAIRSPYGNARALTIVFAFGNIAYLTTVVILYDYSDQNRILFEVSPLFTILLGALFVFVMRRYRVSQSRISKSNGATGESLTRVSAKPVDQA